MIKVDLNPQVIDFLNGTGHVIRLEGVTHMCANPYWYKYSGENEWEILGPEDLPEEIKTDYINYLENFLSQLRGEKPLYETTYIPLH